MKKAFYLPLLFIISIYSISFSQQATKITLDSEYLANKTVNLNKDPNNYTGSPYYNTQFSTGHIYKNGRLIAANKKVRYNAYKDIFEIKNDLNPKSNIVNTIARKSSISIKIGIQEYHFFRPSEKNNLYGYFIVLLKNDNLSVYKKIKKKYTPSQEATSSMDTNIAAFYKEYSILYIVNANGYFIEVPKSKKAKIDLFENHKKEVKTFIKENKIKLKKEKDFIKLVYYYNSL